MTLKELRISKKLTQVEVSTYLGVPLRTYKRLECDDSYQGSYKYNYAYQKLSEFSKKKDSHRYDVVIVGAGYVGYSLGVVLGKHNNVTLIDINKDKVDLINKEGVLKASLPNLDLYKNKDFIFICVPTNYDETTKLLDVKGVTQIVNDIRSVNNKVTIVIKSTCYVGFTSSLKDNNIIYCPEFLREKTALEDMRSPSRIIIGCDNKSNKIDKLSKMLTASAINNPNVLIMGTKEAESVKLFSNTYLALRVAFFNELDTFAKDNEINTSNIINGVSLDPRIGDYYNKPSPGYGGKCLPKDTLTLANQSKGILISSISRSNEDRKKRSK